MRRAGRKSEDDRIEGSWMNTYADLVTLLLCFFVLLFAMSVLDNQKFKKFILSFQSNNDRIIESYEAVEVPIAEDENMDTEKVEETEDERFEKITTELKEFVASNNLESSVSVYHEAKGVLIRFSDSVLFDKGQAVLKSDALRILKNMAALLHRYERMIKVEGHTDSDPINTPLYPSNWELSTARAVNVVKFFIEGVPREWQTPPHLLQAAGYGEYHPLAENNNEKNKAMNRRIEIVILKNTVTV